ncbi:MAG TPA: cyclic nucleotide-binding domain-containing protein [Acidimicrobiales bacterium]|nr:cyclic nucleotide-binding domain-containing protein [Acidimicrobiales bacterium]
MISEDGQRTRSGADAAVAYASTIRGTDTGEELMKVSGLFLNAQRTVEVSAGAAIFHEGDAGEEMFGVVEGTVELRSGDKVLRTLGPDDVFGEMSLLDRTPRSATAIALTDCVLAAIDRRRFLFLVQETPMFALQVMSAMASRLRGDVSDPDDL